VTWDVLFAAAFGFFVGFIVGYLAGRQKRTLERF
jgi:ABC-type dipeptide/oligopeptide/nickel transport system permease subunit